MNSCLPRSAASGPVSGRSHSPQTISGSGMFFLDYAFLRVSYSQTSLNMKHRVEFCGRIKCPRLCLRLQIIRLSASSNAEKNSGWSKD